MSLTPGSVTVGGTDLNSVVDGTQLDSHGNVTTDDSKTAATIETNSDSLTYKAKSDSGKHELGIADTNGVDWNIDTSGAGGRTQVEAGNSTNPVHDAVNVTTGSGRSEVAVYSNADSRIAGGDGNLTATVGGSGDTSLWGGTGNALLIGAKDARDEFFFFGESGRDTIEGFAAGTEDTSDVLNLFGSAITDIRATESGVEIFTTKDSKVLLQGLKPDDKLQWTSGETRGVAKVGAKSEANTFTYEADVTSYLGGDKKDTLKVSGASNDVSLENIGSSIEIIDASNATGDNILAGGREAETIKGGRGSTSLWGGTGGNDVLEGGSGYNEFYFGKGEGAGLITKSNDGDKVMLYNVKLEDLNTQATGLKDGSMVIALKDGSTLTLQNYDSHSATTFQLADGTFSYDRTTGSWQEMK